MRIAITIAGPLIIALCSLSAHAKQQDPTCVLQVFRSVPAKYWDIKKQDVAGVLNRANAGDKESQVAVAMLYSDGRFVAKDVDKGIEWARRAAKAGGAAEKELVRYLELTRGDDQNPNQSDPFAVVRKGAESDVLLYQYMQAELLKSSAPHDAIRWYEKAAAKGCMDARTKLSEIYSYQTKPDHVRAYMWISLADYATGFEGETKKHMEYDETRVRGAQVRLRGKMKPSEIAEAERLAARWAKEHGEAYAVR